MAPWSKASVSIDIVMKAVDTAHALLGGKPEFGRNSHIPIPSEHPPICHGFLSVSNPIFMSGHILHPVDIPL